MECPDGADVGHRRGRLLGQAPFEGGLERLLLGLAGLCLLELDLGLSAVDVDGRDLVVEERSFGEAPTQAGIGDARRFRYERASAPRPAWWSRGGLLGARSRRAGCETASRRPGTRRSGRWQNAGKRPRRDRRGGRLRSRRLSRPVARPTRPNRRAGETRSSWRTRSRMPTSGRRRRCGGSSRPASTPGGPRRCPRPPSRSRLRTNGMCA